MMEILRKAGLAEKEARVYLSALELGKASADQLAKHAKVNRSTTYVQIEALMKKGLMTTLDEGRKTYFMPESPAHLERLLEEEKQELASAGAAIRGALPALTSLFEHGGERPHVRFFDGKEGLLAMREEWLSAGTKEIFVISSYDAMAEVFTKEERDRYSERRAGKGIFSHLIYTRKAGPITEPPPKNTERVYISPDKMDTSTEVVLFDDKVAFMNLKGKITGILIVSRSLHDSLRSIFALLKQTGTEG